MEDAINNLPAGKSAFHMALLKILWLNTKRDPVIFTKCIITSVFNWFKKKTLAGAKEAEINKTSTVENSGT